LGVLAASVVFFRGCDDGTDAGTDHNSPANNAPAALVAGDPDFGRELYAATCATCHGPDLKGLPNQGQELRQNAFVAKHNDKELLDFLVKGRMPDAPDTTMKLLMPPRGGNPTMTDQKLMDIIAYLRQVQNEAKAEAPAAAGH
jgi:mono/diheme cytochrome c family protein